MAYEPKLNDWVRIIGGPITGEIGRIVEIQDAPSQWYQVSMPENGNRERYGWFIPSVLQPIEWRDKT